MKTTREQRSGLRASLTAACPNCHAPPGMAHRCQGREPEMRDLCVALLRDLDEAERIIPTRERIESAIRRRLSDAEWTAIMGGDQ